MARSLRNNRLVLLIQGPSAEGVETSHTFDDMLRTQEHEGIIAALRDQRLRFPQLHRCRTDAWQRATEALEAGFPSVLC
jgi:hypothetical protein